jgi:hypothetical protein
MAGTIGIGVLFVVGLVLGVGFLVHGLRHSGAVSMLVASALLFLGPAAVTCAVLAARVAQDAPALSDRLAVAAAVTSSIGVSSGALATALIFRRGSRLGWLATALLVTAMFACVIGAATAPAGMDLRRPPTGFRLGYQVLQLGTILWSSIEAFATWRFLRRRVQLGLARPFVAHRLALWSLACFAVTLGMAVGFFSTFFGVHYAGQSVEIPMAACGFLAATAIWLSFLPPARYRAWVEGGRPAPEEEGPFAPDGPLD